MKIHFRYVGGFGGLRLGCDLNTELLPKAEATKLKRLIKKANLSTTTLHGSEKARDLFNYTIKIETEDETITAAFDDMSIPENAEPLLEFLRSHARAVPLKE
jgi:hypothetical protein